MRRTNRVAAQTPPAASAPSEPLWRDGQTEHFFNVPAGTMRRARNSGRPPELAQIAYVRFGRLVRYEPEVCRAAKDRMRVVPDKGEGAS